MPTRSYWIHVQDTHTNKTYRDGRLKRTYPSLRAAAAAIGDELRQHNIFPGERSEGRSQLVLTTGPLRITLEDRTILREETQHTLAVLDTFLQAETT